jgi:hypothetical protein
MLCTSQSFLLQSPPSSKNTKVFPEILFRVQVKRLIGRRKWRQDGADA